MISRKIIKQTFPSDLWSSGECLIKTRPTTSEREHDYDPSIFPTAGAKSRRPRTARSASAKSRHEPGYTPKQLQYGTGGPKQRENLYTRSMLEQAFGDFHNVTIVEEEREMHEGASHAGMSAVIGLTATKP
jgi:hypothetical protein